MTTPSFPIAPVNSGFATCPQLTPEHMAEVKALGFKAVINSRPDGEGGPEQPLNAAVEAAARALGLDYAYIPIPSASQTDADILAMKAAIGRMPQPVLGFCRSGARIKRLYDLAQSC